jgi:hypothetical protein
MKQIEINGNFVCYDDYHLEEKKELLNFLECDYLQQIINSFDKKVIIVLG